MSIADPAAARRGYDARSRRERAERERQVTRRRVVDAATRLFIEKGYTGTTVAEIAREAGVALQSVYKAGRSKADLLHLVVDRAVAGDDNDVLVQERPSFAGIADARDNPARQIKVIADLIADTQERSAPVQTAYREAAATDPTVAASFVAAHQRRYETFAVAISMIDSSALRLPPDQSTDLLWTIGSPEAFHLLRDLRGWTPRRYRDWLTQTLNHQLLKTDGAERRKEPRATRTGQSRTGKPQMPDARER